jgi:hypothetical protein
MVINSPFPADFSIQSPFGGSVGSFKPFDDNDFSRISIISKLDDNSLDLSDSKQSTLRRSARLSVLSDVQPNYDLLESPAKNSRVCTLAEEQLHVVSSPPLENSLFNISQNTPNIKRKRKSVTTAKLFEDISLSEISTLPIQTCDLMDEHLSVVEESFSMSPNQISPIETIKSFLLLTNVSLEDVTDILQEPVLDFEEDEYDQEMLLKAGVIYSGELVIIEWVY